MSTNIEKRAKDYLINEYKDPKYSFTDSNQNGFDLWLCIEGQQDTKIELKATDMVYEENKQSKIFSQLYFSSEDEVKLFKNGESKIVRIFLGNEPPKIFIINNSVFNKGARFEPDYRQKIAGSINYGEEAIEMVQ